MEPVPIFPCREHAIWQLNAEDATRCGGVVSEWFVVAENVKVAMDALRGRDHSDWISNDSTILRISGGRGLWCGSGKLWGWGRGERQEKEGDLRI